MTNHIKKVRSAFHRMVRRPRQTTRLYSMAVLAMTTKGSWAAIRYSVTDLGPSTVAYAVNNRGDVAGSVFSSTGREAAAYYTNGSWHSIDLQSAMLPFEGDPLRTVATGINDKLEVVGSWLAYVNPLLTAAPFVTNEGQGGFYFNGTSAISLGADVLAANGINNASQIVGTVVNPNGTASAFRYSDGTLQKLGVIGGDLNSWGNAINDKGDVVGVSSLGSLSSGHPFIRASGPPQPLLGFNAGNGKALAINDQRDVVGTLTVDDVTHGFIHVGSTTTIINTGSNGSTEALSINRFGQVVGRRSDDTGDSGFVYKNSSIIDLDSVIINAPEVHIDRAVSINNSGQIAANGSIGGVTHSFLLSPVETSSVPRLFVVAVGSTDANKYSLKATDGRSDASAIEAKLRQFNTFAESRLLLYDYDSAADASPIRTAIANLEGEVRPDDTVIFYYGGHGSGGVNSNEIMDVSVNAFVEDWQLTNWFGTDRWSTVNKLFIFDSCFAGGFAGGSDMDERPDLDSLPKAAILAAATETELSGSAPLLSANSGRGVFTLELEDALTLVNGYARADLNRDGLSFEELESFLREHVAMNGTYQGFIRQDPYEDDDGTTRFSPNVFAHSTADFELAIPEPFFGFFALIALFHSTGRTRRL